MPAKTDPFPSLLNTPGKNYSSVTLPSSKEDNILEKLKSEGVNLQYVPEDKLRDIVKQALEDPIMVDRLVASLQKAAPEELKSQHLEVHLSELVLDKAIRENRKKAEPSDIKKAKQVNNTFQMRNSPKKEVMLAPPLPRKTGKTYRKNSI